MMSKRCSSVLQVLRHCYDVGSLLKQVPAPDVGAAPAPAAPCGAALAAGVAALDPPFWPAPARSMAASTADSCCALTVGVLAVVPALSIAGVSSQGPRTLGGGVGAWAQYKPGVLAENTYYHVLTRMDAFSLQIRIVMETHHRPQLTALHQHCLPRLSLLQAENPPLAAGVPKVRMEQCSPSPSLEIPP